MMQRGTILVTAPTLGGKAPQMIADAGFKAVYTPAEITDFPAFAKQVQANNPPVVATIVRTAHINSEVLSILPDLKIISKHGAGVDSIDVEAAKQRGIRVTKTTGANARSVAELTLGLMFACARNIVPFSMMTAKGEWNRAAWQGEELSAKTLGLIGFGQIGYELVQISKAIFPQIVVYDPFVDSSKMAELGVQAVTLQQLVQQADVISLHCPLTPDTKQMINKDFLAQVRRGSYLINAARGDVVDESAVVDALNSGQLAGAGFDSLQFEGAENTLLRSHPLTVITPHVGGSTKQALEVVAKRSVTNIIHFFEGKEIAPYDVVC